MVHTDRVATTITVLQRAFMHARNAGRTSYAAVDKRQQTAATYYTTTCFMYYKGSVCVAMKNEVIGGKMPQSVSKNE